MHVVLVSLCEKKAWKRSRAILDSYALRFGERTWMSPMTVEGIRELRAALRRTATRQTSVACFKNVGRSKMTLLWVVGSRENFGRDGVIPVSIQHEKKKRDFPVWGKTASLLAGAAGIMHDLGKFGDVFQQKLTRDGPMADPVRHEWLSLILSRMFLERFPYQNEETGPFLWTRAWESLEKTPEKNRYAVGDPFLSPLEDANNALLYVIATHHRLPKGAAGSIENTAHVRDERCVATPVATPHPLVFERMSGLLHSLEKASASNDPLYWKAMAWISRAALILADHSVSAREPSPDEMPFLEDKSHQHVYANTKRSGDKRVFNQELNWHLLEVGRTAQEMIYRILSLAPPSLSPESIEKIERSAGGPYQWQNRAARTLTESASKNVPHLVFNTAGTGSGKTRMNARAICSLRHESGNVRFATALNLRTLTLQTGDAYRNQLGIGSDELACVIGDRLAQRLFEQTQKERNNLQREEDEDGNEINNDLDIEAGFEWENCPAWLDDFFAKKTVLRSVIGAPVLVSTVDFLVDAGDPRRQGRHALAMLRLMTSDLILDEIDSYDPNPLMAVLRLVWLAGLFGRHVVVSSATLSRPVARMVWESFASGVRAKGLLEERTASFRSVIINDMTDPLIVEANDGDAFLSHYETHLNAMQEKLEARRYRRAFLQPVSPLTQQKPQETLQNDPLHQAVESAIKQLHVQNHLVDPKTGINISFGLVRMANIAPAVRMASYLSRRLPESARIACYHSQHPMIVRWSMESRLDALLNRQKGDAHIFADPEIRQILDELQGRQNMLFIVVATPVEEIGRDHDFDWAIIEPSSTQSIVQTAGRVNRLRRIMVNTPNIAILQYNRNFLKHQGKRSPVFHRPGLETGEHLYKSHDLADLLDWNWLNDNPLDARLRFDPRHRFGVEDDRSLERQTKTSLAIITEGSVNDGGKNHNMGWMSEDYYRKTALRTHNERKVEFYLPDPENNPDTIVLIEEGSIALGKIDRKIPIVSWSDRHSPSNAPLRKNAWLALSGRDMIDMIKKFEMSIEEGTKVHTTFFEKREIYRDPDFGFFGDSCRE